MPWLALQSDGAGEQVVLRSINEKGETVFEKTYSGSLRAVSGWNDHAALLFQSRLITVDCSGAEPQESTIAVTGARDVVTRRDGKHILIYADRAELVTAGEEES